MSKASYCVGRINKNETVMDIAAENNNESDKITSSKRVNIVSIRMVRESSVLYKNRKISSPSDAFDLLKEFLEGSDREQLLVCSLDTKNQPNTINICSIGTINSSLVHPREIFKTAILSNAASIIVAHNHPSNDANPSTEDINITIRLKECGKLLGIDLLDHIIIGEDKFISLKEKGIL